MKFRQCDYIVCGLLILYICGIPYLPKNFIEMFNSTFVKLVGAICILILCMTCNPCCAVLASIAYLQTIFEAQKSLVNTVSNDFKKVALQKEIVKQNRNITSKIQQQSAYTLPTELLDKPTNIEGFFSGNNNNITEEPLLKAKQEFLKKTGNYYPADGQYSCKKHKVENPCAFNGTLTSSTFDFSPF